MCGTSRYSTITGRYPSRSSYGRSISETNLRDVKIPLTKLEDILQQVGVDVDDPNDCSENNIAALLKNKYGYRTGVVGKWHLSADNDNDENDNDNDDNYKYNNIRSKIKKCGFDYAEAIYKENMDKKWNINIGNGGGNLFEHNMEHVTSKGIEFITMNKYDEEDDDDEKDDDDDDEEDDDDEKDDNDDDDEDDDEDEKPFFLYFNPTVPHSSSDVTDALNYADCRDTVEGTLKRPPFIPFGMTADYNDKDCSKYRQSVLDRARLNGVEDDDKMVGSIWVDDSIGSLLQTLEDKNILNNTFILFQLDHGESGKGSLFEGGSKIVQFIHYPDLFITNQIQSQNQNKYDGLVSTIDIVPTILDIINTNTNKNNNGTDQASSSNVTAISRSVDDVNKNYGMDGISWLPNVLMKESSSTAPDSGSDSDSDSDSVRTTNTTHTSSKSDSSNASNQRCLYVEQGMDRSVRCGCYKYISIYDPDSSAAYTTVRDANDVGIDIYYNNFYYLCHKNDNGTDTDTGLYYINSPEISPERRNRQWHNRMFNESLKKELIKKVTCLKNLTNPFMSPNYDKSRDISCDLPLQRYQQQDEQQEQQTTTLDDSTNITFTVENKNDNYYPPIKINESSSITASFIDNDNSNNSNNKTKTMIITPTHIFAIIAIIIVSSLLLFTTSLLCFKKRNKKTKQNNMNKNKNLSKVLSNNDDDDDIDDDDDDEIFIIIPTDTTHRPIMREFSGKIIKNNIDPHYDDDDDYETPTIIADASSVAMTTCIADSSFESSATNMEPEEEEDSSVLVTAMRIVDSYFDDFSSSFATTAAAATTNEDIVVSQTPLSGSTTTIWDKLTEEHNRRDKLRARLVEASTLLVKVGNHNTKETTCTCSTTTTEKASTSTSNESSDDGRDRDRGSISSVLSSRRLSSKFIDERKEQEI